MGGRSVPGPGRPGAAAAPVLPHGAACLTLSAVFFTFASMSPVDTLRVEFATRALRRLFLFSAHPQINNKANVVTSPKENAPLPALVQLDSVTPPRASLPRSPRARPV